MRAHTFRRNYPRGNVIVWGLRPSWERPWWSFICRTTRSGGHLLLSPFGFQMAYRPDRQGD